MVERINSLEELEVLIHKAFADTVAKWQGNPVIVLLSGDLGAGKTASTRIIAQMFHVKHLIKSPTFIYVDEHEFELNNKLGILYHWDLWRLKAEDFPSLDIEGKLVPGTIHVIEWWKRYENEIESLLSKHNWQVIRIHLAETENPESRVVTLETN